MNKVKLIGAGVLIATTIAITAIAINIETPSAEVATTAATSALDSDDSSTSTKKPAREKDDTKDDAKSEDSLAKPQGASETTAPKNKSKPSVPKAPSGSHYKQSTKSAEVVNTPEQSKTNDVEATNTSEQGEADGPEELALNSTESESKPESTSASESESKPESTSASESESETETEPETGSETESAAEQAAAAAAAEAELAARLAAELAQGTTVPQPTNTYPEKDNCPAEHDSFYSTTGYPVCECTSYVAWKAYEAFGITLAGFGNANFWDTMAAASGYVVDSTPTKNSIAQVKNQPYGHLYWVEEINSDGSLLVTDYNNSYSTYLLTGDYHSHDFGAMTIPANQVTSLKYIHPDRRLW